MYKWKLNLFKNIVKMFLYDTACIWINMLGEVFAYTVVMSINMYTTTQSWKTRNVEKIIYKYISNNLSHNSNKIFLFYLYISKKPS